MSIYQEKAKACVCCSKHVPLPTRLKDYNGVLVCPTTFDNIHEYRRVWLEIGSRPPGSIRKHFSEYVQKVVEQYLDKTDNKIL
jgi:hypothetical protein